MKKNYDYAILEGGWNDFNLDVAIGELSDDKSDDKTDSKINNKAEGKNNDKNSSPDNDKNEDISQDKELDTTTLMGALENMFKYVKTNHEDTKVYFLMVHKIDETNGNKIIIAATQINFQPFSTIPNKPLCARIGITGNITLIMPKINTN